jgi:hypothetical protein
MVLACVALLVSSTIGGLSRHCLAPWLARLAAHRRRVVSIVPSSVRYTGLRDDHDRRRCGPDQVDQSGRVGAQMSHWVAVLRSAARVGSLR